MNMRWAAKEQNILNLHMKSDDKFPTAYRFKQLLLNSMNKEFRTLLKINFKSMQPM